MANNPPAAGHNPQVAGSNFLVDRNAQVYIHRELLSMKDEESMLLGSDALLPVNAFLLAITFATLSLPASASVSSSTPPVTLVDNSARTAFLVSLIGFCCFLSSTVLATFVKLEGKAGAKAVRLFFLPQLSILFFVLGLITLVISILFISIAKLGSLSQDLTKAAFGIIIGFVVLLGLFCSVFVFMRRVKRAQDMRDVEAHPNLARPQQ